MNPIARRGLILPLTRTERTVEAGFWLTLAGIFGSVGALLVFESYARYTGRVPTISEKAAFAAFKHPNSALGISFIAGSTLGALVSHFGFWIPSGRKWVKTGPWKP